MSQRSRPGSAQTLADQQRMPFAAAEALLWGRKTHDEHMTVIARMLELEGQHRAYNARIQATEAVAEAAEASTARIRRVEQQVAAIESDEQERPFDKWVEGEVAGFKVFMEKNKTVRQKQIELETKISGIEDSIDKAIDTSADIEILLERIGRLESDRLKDASHIKKLESDVAELKIRRQTQAMEVVESRPEAARKFTLKNMLPPPPTQRLIEVEDAADETEDEEILPVLPAFHLGREQVEVPLSSKTMAKSTSTIVPLPPQKGRDDMSARLRMMQRKSIHDPKHSRENGPRQTEAPIPLTKPLPHPSAVSLPATQVVRRPHAEKQTRGQNELSHAATRLPIKQLVVKLPLSTLKRKVEEDVPVPRITRSQAKRNRDMNHDDHTAGVQPRVSVPQEIISTMETQIVSEPAAKRRKPNSTRYIPQPRSAAEIAMKKTVQAPQSVANLVKTVPRKAAASTATKRPKQTKATVQQQTPALSIPRKDTPKSSASTSTTKHGSRSGVTPKEKGPSNSGTLNPSKPAALGKEKAASSGTMGTPFSRSGTKTHARARPTPFISPVTLD